MYLPLRGPVEVGRGEVTEVEARMRAGVAGGSSVAGSSGSKLSESELATLPVDGGQWRSLALVNSYTNGAAGADDAAEDVSFRGVAVTENSSRTDGASGDESFGGTRGGAGIDEPVDVGADTVLDRASGIGVGGGSVADGGRRAGSAYTFAQGAVREFRVDGQGDAAAYGSALYGHGVGGVVSTVSRSGGTTLHGMAFYTVRDSAWAAANPFSVASSYANGVVTSGVVKPEDRRHQFGGRVGGPLLLWNGSDRGLAQNADRTQRVFYFYAFDQQQRSFPAVSSPGYAGFYALTATQVALLGNRGVSAAKTAAALNYLDSLTGTVARQAGSDGELRAFGLAAWRWEQGGAGVQPGAMEFASGCSDGGSGRSGIGEPGVEFRLRGCRCGAVGTVCGEWCE